MTIVQAGALHALRFCVALVLLAGSSAGLALHTVGTMMSEHTNISYMLVETLLI